MNMVDRLINRHIDDIEPTGTSHASGMKKVISATLGDAMIVRQIAMGMLTREEIIPAHTHADMDECYFFLEGEGFMYIDDVAISLREGKVINVPAGSKHSMVCTEGSLRFFYLCLELANK